MFIVAVFHFCQGQFQLVATFNIIKRYVDLLKRQILPGRLIGKRDVSTFINQQHRNGHSVDKHKQPFPIFFYLGKKQRVFHRYRRLSGNSGGQRQMVAMGKALMLEPKILLLDEPTAGLSPKYRGEIFSLVRTINAAGTPILMVEQNAKQALGIAHRGYVLVDGQNRFTGTGRELIEDREVAQMFLGGGH